MPSDKIVIRKTKIEEDFLKKFPPKTETSYAVRQALLFYTNYIDSINTIMQQNEEINKKLDKLTNIIQNSSVSVLNEQNYENISSEPSNEAMKEDEEYPNELLSLYQAISMR